MKKLIQAETGEYENRCTSFVAVDKEAALRYLKETQPAVDWELFEEYHCSPAGTPADRCFTPYTDIFVAPKDRKVYRYDLSEIDFVE